MVKHAEEMTSSPKSRPPVEDDESLYSSSESGFGEPRSPRRPPSPRESLDFESLYRRVVGDCPRLRLIAGRGRGDAAPSSDGGSRDPSRGAGDSPRGSATYDRSGRSTVPAPETGNSWDSGVGGSGRRAPADPLGLGLTNLEPAAPLRSGEYAERQGAAPAWGYPRPAERAEAQGAGFPARPAYAAPDRAWLDQRCGWAAPSPGCSCAHPQQQQQHSLPPPIGRRSPPYPPHPPAYLPAVAPSAQPGPGQDYRPYGPAPPRPAPQRHGFQASAGATASVAGGREAPPDGGKRTSGAHGDGSLPPAWQARIAPVTVRRSHLHESMCKVFITYSLDSAPHVLNLAKFLCANGFNTMLDVFAEQLRGIDVIKFMDTFLLDKDYMIVVAVSPGYRRDVEGSGGSLETTEHSLHTRYIYRQLQNQYIQQGCLNFRVIPVLMPTASKDDVPSWLQSTLCFRWPRDLEGILLRLMREEKIVPPPVGELPTITMVPV